MKFNPSTWFAKRSLAVSNRGTAPSEQPRRSVVRVVRGFAAAQVDRLLAGWRYDGGFTPMEVSSHLETIRARSRQMAKDSPHYRRWLDLFAVNVVGEGFKFRSMPQDGRPGDFRLDEKAAAFIEYHWWRFCTWRDPDTGATWYDYSGRKTEAESDRMCAKQWARDGEYFIHILRTESNPYGIAFRVLRPDWCDHTYNMADTGRGTFINAGVEMDRVTRRPVAYWFYTAPTNAYAYNTRGQPILRISANEIIHGFTPEDEDQPRGIPMAHAVLRKLKMLDEFDVAELTAARDEACSVRTYYAPRGEESEILDLTDEGNQEAADALTAPKEPGQAEVLPLGYKQEVHTPQHPNREVANFKNSMLKDVSSGFNVEYANFTNNWDGVSFSSVRVGTISERDMYKVRQADMISQKKTREFRAWLKSFLELQISGGLPAEKYEKFVEHKFRGRRWLWVDPERDVAAAEKARNYMWKTDSEITEDLDGDYFDNLDQYKREQEARNKANFTPAPSPGAPKPKEPANAQE